MTPEAASRLANRYGQIVILRRLTMAGTAAIAFDAEIRAKIRAYQPEELVGLITQADREAVIAAIDLLALQWPVPPREGANADRLVLDGKVGVVQAVEPRASFSGEVAMYAIRVRLP